MKQQSRTLMNLRSVSSLESEVLLPVARGYQRLGDIRGVAGLETLLALELVLFPSQDAQ